MTKPKVKKLNEKTLTRVHATAMLRLQRKHTSPETFTPRDIYSIIHAIENNRVVGLFDGRKLIAYSILDTDIPDDDYRLVDSALPGHTIVYKFAGSVVHSRYRGRGIQQMLLTSHVEYANSKRASAVIAYVHEDNAPSIRNIEAAGLKRIARRFIDTKQDYRLVYGLSLS